MLQVKLTGARRYRTEHVRRGFFSRPVLILQVQRHVSGYEADSQGGGRDVDYREWIDALPEHVTEHEVVAS